MAVRYCREDPNVAALLVHNVVVLYRVLYKSLQTTDGTKFGARNNHPNCIEQGLVVDTKFVKAS